jgi:DNA-binding transcriptional LysR family regulator
MESARCRAFVAAAETGSFTRAAEALGYTPSGVSQLVNALEGELGVTLLSRGRKGVSVTPDGGRMLPAVREYLAKEEAIYQLAAGIKGLEVGSVTIAAYSSIAAHWLPQVISDFGREYPGIKISLAEGIRQEVVQRLEDRTAELGFMSYEEPMPYDWIPLAEDRMLAVLPKSHPLAGAESYPLSRCAEEDFIMPAQGRDSDVLAVLAKNGLTPKIKFSTIENFAAMAMIEKGLGMSIMNELITRGWSCDAVMLPLTPPESITLGMALPSLSGASPAVKRFVKFAAQRLTRAEN